MHGWLAQGFRIRPFRFISPRRSANLWPKPASRRAARRRPRKRPTQDKKEEPHAQKIARADARRRATDHRSRRRHLLVRLPDPTEAHARQIFDNLLKQRFDKPAKVLSFKQTMTERLEMHATGEKGFGFFFNASVAFPEGANLECKPDDAGKSPDGCSSSKHYVTAPRNSDPKGKQFVAPGETVAFDEEYRFYADTRLEGPRRQRLQVVKEAREYPSPTRGRRWPRQRTPVASAGLMAGSDEGASRKGGQLIISVAFSQRDFERPEGPSSDPC